MDRIKGRHRIDSPSDGKFLLHAEQPAHFLQVTVLGFYQSISREQECEETDAGVDDIQTPP